MPKAIETKNEILDTFKDICFFYNDSSKLATLSNCLDEYAYAISNEYSIILKNLATSVLVDYLSSIPKDERTDACEELICSMDRLDVIDINYVEIY